jgi:diguanylate cyclase
LGAWCRSLGPRPGGVRIAIDEFGTGYAVLSQLKSLPVDTLKIATAFVRNSGTNPGDLAIIGLAEAFGLQLLAEGVETPLPRRR